MLMIRLQRVGRKHEPTFRVVLTDSKNSTKSGRFQEVLGSYDPRKKTEVFEGDRIKEWMGKGAKLSGTVHNLLVSHKVIEGKKKNVLPYKKPFKSEAKLAAEKADADAKVAKEAADKAAEEKVVEEVPVAEAANSVEATTAEEVTAEPIANPEMKDETVPAVAPAEDMADEPAPELPITPEEKES
jgi:small subunit ribosomal protein S16